MIMLIQQEEKKENSSFKRHEMSKWSFGNVILMTDWNTVFTAILNFSYSTEILDDPQINVELNTFLNFFNQGTNL